MRKSVEIIKDEKTGKVTSILADGKPVKKSLVNAWNKASLTPYFREYSGNKIGVNPYTEIKVELTPIEATIYSFCMRWYQVYTCQFLPPTTLSTYDGMKYLLLEINNDAYYDLLD